MSKDDLTKLVYMVFLCAFLLGVSLVGYVLLFFKSGFLNVALIGLVVSFFLGKKADKQLRVLKQRTV